MPYQPYRGSRRARKGKIFMIIAFALLALVVAVVVYFAAQEYLVFTAEGFRLEFPFLGGQTEPATEPVPPDETVTVEIVDTTAPTAPPTTAPATSPPAVKMLTGARLAAAEALSEWQDSLAPALYAKNADGVWHIPQSDGQASAEQSAVLEALAQSGGAAVISAMRDAVGPRSSRVFAVTTTGGLTWLDYDYISWYNPYSGGGGLADTVLTCAEAGVSELIFTNLQFPTRGRLEYITYGDGDTPESRVAAVSALLAPCREYLDTQRAQMYLSVVLTDTAAEQFVDEAAGQDVRELALLCDILYVQTSDPDYDINLLLDAIQGTGCRVGLWLDSGDAPDRQIDFVLLK